MCVCIIETLTLFCILFSYCELEFVCMRESGSHPQRKASCSSCVRYPALCEICFPPAGPYHCPQPGMFQCKNDSSHKCLFPYQICDGTPQCANASDESQCGKCLAGNPQPPRTGSKHTKGSQERYLLGQKQSADFQSNPEMCLDLVLEF